MRLSLIWVGASLLAGYIGAERCKLCHRAVFESWQRTSHSSTAPVGVAAEERCLSCHTSGGAAQRGPVRSVPWAVKITGLRRSILRRRRWRDSSARRKRRVAVSRSDEPDHAREFVMPPEASGIWIHSRKPWFSFPCASSVPGVAMADSARPWLILRRRRDGLSTTSLCRGADVLARRHGACVFPRRISVRSTSISAVRRSRSSAVSFRSASCRWEIGSRSTFPLGVDLVFTIVSTTYRYTTAHREFVMPHFRGRAGRSWIHSRKP